MFFRTTLPGLNHLWFMEVIVLCYLILPLVDWILSKKTMFGIVIFIIVSGSLLAFRYNSTYLWITLYYIGYLCGRYSSIQGYVLLTASCVSTWVMFDSGFNLEFWKNYSLQNNILHASMGAVIFLSLYFCLSHVKLSCRISSLFARSGSYEVYLTHHIYILGPLSLLWLTPFLSLNCLIVLVLTIISTYGMIQISELSNRLIDRVKMVRLYNWYFVVRNKFA